MSQQEILDFLEKNKEKMFNSKELAKELNISMSSITTNLTKLKRHNLVLFKETPIFNNDKRTRYDYQFKP